MNHFATESPHTHEWNGWTIDGLLRRGSKIKLSNGKYQAVGIPFYISDHYAKLMYCTISFENNVVFVGSCGFQLDMSNGITMEYGVVYMNNKPRILAEFTQTNDIAFIEEVYDERGVLACRAIPAYTYSDENEEDGEISDFDGCFPRLMKGTIDVFGLVGEFMYTAIYDNKGHIKDVLSMLRDKEPLVYSIKDSIKDGDDKRLTDFVSHEPISYGDICYAFNTPVTSTGHFQVVSASTLRDLGKYKLLRSHPLTRAPILRIFKLCVKIQ